MVEKAGHLVLKQISGIAEAMEVQSLSFEKNTVLVGSFAEALVLHTLLVTAKSLASFLTMTGSLLTVVSNLVSPMDGRFPLDQLYKGKNTFEENKDASETEDDEDENDVDDGDDDEDDEDFSGDEGEEEADSDDDVEANGVGGSGDEDDDNDDEDEEDGEEDGEEDEEEEDEDEEEEDEDEEEESPQPPSKKRK
ncbi:hypothetical protein VNO77_24210 [Canavalia gladiata]|uniref:Uncharacterized protein n=1 Tax=Canavalia gladiata TaxID=3824 RepID=A0AAN9L5V2_CANGL